MKRIITIKKLLYNLLYLGIRDKPNLHKVMDKEIFIFDLFKEFYKQRYIILITIIISTIISTLYFNYNKNIVYNSKISINFLAEYKDNELRNLTRKYNNLLSVLNQFQRDYIIIEEVMTSEIIPKFTQTQNERIISIYLDTLSDSFIEPIAIKYGIINEDENFKGSRNVVSKYKKNSIYYISLDGIKPELAEKFLIEVFEMSIFKLADALSKIYYDRISNDLDFLETYKVLLDNKIATLNIRMQEDLDRIRFNKEIANKLSIALPDKEFRNQIIKYEFFLGTEVLDDKEQYNKSYSTYLADQKIIENQKKFLADIFMRMKNFKDNIDEEIRNIYNIETIDYAVSYSVSDNTINKIIFTQIIILIASLLLIIINFVLKMNRINFSS